MELPFAGLHQLCLPMLDRLSLLPEPQRDALSTAFGLRGPGESPDRFLVGLATLTLLSDVAAERPVLCVVDDAQWLDRASAQALAFVARRLRAEAVAVVFAERESSRELAGLPELAVDGLADDDARALLESVVTGPLDERVRDRIVAETHGNPLALLELPHGLSHAELAGGFGLPTGSALSGRIEESFRRRLSGLPPSSRELLLIAAAEPVGDPLTVWRAAELLGVGAQAAVPASRAGLVEFGGRVRFRHPLVRSAAYRSSSLDDRLRAHRALAEATDPEADPDRRAWHLAHATPALDEHVAAELEESAGRAQARGGLAAAAAFLRRAADLTPEPEPRARRALAAAQCSQEAGAPDARPRAPRHGGGRPPRRASARPRRASAGADPVCRRSRSRCPAAAARGRQAARDARRQALARDLPRRILRRALRGPPRSRAPAYARSPRPSLPRTGVSPATSRRAHPICFSTAWPC